MVKIGIIGCGGMGKLHSEILKKMEGDKGKRSIKFSLCGMSGI